MTWCFVCVPGPKAIVFLAEQAILEIEEKGKRADLIAGIDERNGWTTCSRAKTSRPRARWGSWWRATFAAEM